jgi:drug/metabolite transporter (DMT)-like permease
MLASYDLMALGAAVCWAAASIISVSPSRYLGAFAFTRWRMLMVALMLWTVTLASGGWRSLPADSWSVMALSGLIGIFVGDTALFAAMNRLGPRRSGVLFATHAMFSALLGFWLLGERMSTQAACGSALTMAGVMTAILWGRHKEDEHSWEADRGHVGTGIALGLLSALCQALGSLIAKPAMGADIDPIAASAVRVSVACCAHFILLWLSLEVARARQPATLRVLAQTALNGFIAMGVGMTLVLLALKGGDIGMVGILSSVSPVLVLPLLWLRLGRAPALGAWLGAALTVAGTTLILLR